MSKYLNHFQFCDAVLIFQMTFVPTAMPVLGLGSAFPAPETAM
jgi:hypothetical protein